MHFLFTLVGLPSYSNHGGAQTCMGIASQMRKEGHQVTVLSMFDTSTENPYGDFKKQNEECLKEIGIKTTYIDYDYYRLINNKPKPHLFWKMLRWSRELFSPQMQDYYPWIYLQKEVIAKVCEIQPDTIFCYHWEPLAALYGFREFPKIAGLGDPTHLPLKEIWKISKVEINFKYLKFSLRTAIAQNSTIHLMKKLLKDCDEYGFFAAHYCKWAKTQGLQKARYFQSPIADPLLNKNWKEERKKNKQNKPKILMIGDLAGTATKQGLKLFALEILPLLEKAIGETHFEVHLIGKGDVSEDLRQALNKKNIKLRGRVDPPDVEFLSSDILLVPTPTNLGIRVRILTGFAYGNCIVSHTANSFGIPELVHEKNALLSSTGVGLAEQIIKVIKNSKLQSDLQEGARNTFESTFAKDKAAHSIIELLMDSGGVEPPSASSSTSDLHA